MPRGWPLMIAPLLLLPFAVGVRAEGPASTRPSEAAAATTQYWFGVAVENIPPAIARLLKLKPDQGLMVVVVLPDSPAHAAGLKPDDLLVSIDGRPLTSQQDLARAANTLAAPGRPRSTSIAYLRDGNPGQVVLTPMPRPTKMLVVNDTSGDFSATTRPSTPKAHRLQAYNYVLPNGAAAQVGPGYRIPLDSGDAATSTVRSIKAIVSQGQTLVLSQETDAAGVVHNSITVGDKVYPVDPDHLDALPAELRPLAQQFLTTPPAATEPGTEALSLEEQVKLLRAENEALKKRLAPNDK